MLLKLKEEVNKIKESNQIEPKYQLNVYVDKPTCHEKELGKMHYDEYWFVDHQGDIHRSEWQNDTLDKARWENTILYKDKLSAETKKELVSDMERLSKKFEHDGANCCLVFNYERNEVDIDMEYGIQSRDYHFTLENVAYIINKYPQKVLKNFIQYCK